MTEFNNCKSPLIGVEYIARCKRDNNEKYSCVLCNKKGNFLNIMHHLTSRKHQMFFLGYHFPIIDKQITTSKLDSKKSLYLVSHLIEKAFGRRAITICDCELSKSFVNHTVKDDIVCKYMNFYLPEDLKVERILSFLREYENNKYPSSKVRVRDYLSSNEKYNLEKETKLVATNYYSSIQSAFETLHVKYNYYKKYPKDHPEYGAEWTAYRMKRLLKYRNILSNNLLIHDYKAGFKKQWDIIFEKLFFKEKQNLVLEIGIQLNLRLDSKQKPLPSTRKHETVQKTTTPARKRSCDEEQSVTDKRIKMSQDNTMPTLDVDKIPEQQNPMSFLSICQQIKGFMFGDLDVKISNIIDEASKSCNENNLKLLQNSKKFKLFEKIRLILIDQTTDNWRDVMKTNEIKKVIEMITVLLKNVVKIPKTKLTLLEDDIKILVLNFSELASQDQYDLISYLEIMKVKNSEFYEKITNTIKEEITLHSENESSLGVEEVIDDSIVISDDDDDDYDLTEVVIKAKQTVDETSCENDSELVTEEDIILNISSDEN